MRATLTASEDKFHQDIINFIDTAYPPAARHSPTALDISRWFEAVSDKGWMTVEWPPEAGGIGWSPVELTLWYQELAIAKCPCLDFFALQIVGPLLWQRGTIHQKRYLDAISRRVEIWGNATLDVSSVQISHSSEHHTYTLQGTAPCLVTTPCDIEGPDRVLLLGGKDGDKSLFLIDMQAPGIELSPISRHGTVSSKGEICDASIFRLDFDHVVLTRDALLGKRTAGQDIINESERNNQSLANLTHLQTALIQLRQLIQSFALEEEFKYRLAEVAIDVHANCITGLRHRFDNKSQPAHAMQPFMLRAKQIAHQLDSLLNDALGYYAIPLLSPEPGTNEPPLKLAANVRGDYARYLVTGQSVEHQYDRIARTILGLPATS